MGQKSRWLLQRLGEVKTADLLLLGETFCVLLAMKIALRCVPVRTLLAWQRRPGHLPQGPLPQGHADEALRQRVRWAVGVVSRRSPVEFVCFPQCLAAAWLLRRGGAASLLHYGVKRQGTELATHTWLESGGEVLIGGEVQGEFVEIEGFGTE